MYKEEMTKDQILNEIDNFLSNKHIREDFKRESLIEFANEMEIHLQLNDKKKGNSWMDCDMVFLNNKLNEELKEYKESGYAKELVDIANICMMLWIRKTQSKTKISGFKK